LRQYGINVEAEIDEAIWFLSPPDDVRSSSFLELAATEFAIQGLELDWIGLCWDGDLRPGDGAWAMHQFQGSNWRVSRDEVRQQYILNKYRVLLTRGREGLVIWVPRGDEQDRTRDPEMYDEIAEALSSFGVPSLD
jgi:DUF2075 family protein